MTVVTSERPLRVLLAGRGIAMAAPLRRAVSMEGALYETAPDGKECLAMVRREPPDVVFMELQGTYVDGIEAIRFMRAEEESRGIPVVVVSGRQDEDARREALAAGATEFLCQPFEQTELQARMAAVLKLARLERELRRVGEELAATRLEDVDTGALQRHYIEQRVGAEVKSARRHQHPLSLISARLDPPLGEGPGYDFRAHLRPTADAIKYLVRDEDLVARFGPDEFLVVMPHTDSYGSLILAERIREAIENLGVGRRISASVGVASCQKSGDFARDAPLARARAAMEKARTQGGNRVVKQD